MLDTFQQTLRSALRSLRSSPAVTGMAILYHQAGIASFVDAKTVAANWGAVDAVQVQLTVESVDKRAGTDTKPITRQFTATTTVRNRVQ